MKRLKKIQISLLALFLMVLTAGRPALAADTTDTKYTYTIRLFAGNKGILTGEGINLDEAPGAYTEKVTNKDGQIDQIVIRGVEYGKPVYINPLDAAKETDDRYYIKGVRRSGRDNSDSVESTKAVGADMDYVIAYGVKGEMTPYTVNYQDEAGNALLPSDTYYGNIGERQYVSARYVDGYQPQAYNMVMTLSANSAENVFNFIYTPNETPVVEEPATTPETPAAATTTTPAAATPAAPAADAGAGAAGADAGAADAGVGGDVAVPDEAVPQANAPDELVNMDDPEDVPLSDGGTLAGEQPGKVMGYLPIYIGIGAAAALALIVTAVYLKKRRSAAVVRSVEVPTDNEK